MTRLESPPPKPGTILYVKHCCICFSFYHQMGEMLEILTIIPQALILIRGVCL